MTIDQLFLGELAPLVCLFVAFIGWLVWTLIYVLGQQSDEPGWTEQEDMRDRWEGGGFDFGSDDMMAEKGEGHESKQA